jgi:hypothetical protein
MVTLRVALTCCCPAHCRRQLLGDEGKELEAKYGKFQPPEAEQDSTISAVREAMVAASVSDFQGCNAALAKYFASLCL